MDSSPCSVSSLCVGVQVYESKLQELQKQVETISLVAETPDEEELEEEEEEEGVYYKNQSVLRLFLNLLYLSKTKKKNIYICIYININKNALCVFFYVFCPEPKLLGCAYF